MILQLAIILAGAATLGVMQYKIEVKRYERILKDLYKEMEEEAKQKELKELENSDNK